jgi:hypothetical protein
MISTLGMAVDPWAGGWLFDVISGYIGSFGLALAPWRSR